MENVIQKIKRFVSVFFPFVDVSLSRENWIRDKLKKIEKNSKILDAGAGECKYKKYCSHLVYESQDFCQYTGVGDGVGLQTKNWNTSNIDIISDITSIPVGDLSYDVVLCTEVLEHVPHPENAIKEFSRILKVGGELILTAPFCSQTHFAPYHYCDGFNIYWYRKHLESNGFKIIEYKRNGNFFDYINQELLRTPITLAKYSPIGIVSFILYTFIIPLVLMIYALSKLSSGSEEQLCLGYHVLAKKMY